MPRSLDVQLQETTRRLRSLVSEVDHLVSDALIKLKVPSFAAEEHAEERQRRVYRLKRELEDHVFFTMASYPPVANDLCFLATVLSVVRDLGHMADCATRIREGAPDIGRGSASLEQLALLSQRTAAEGFVAVFRLDFNHPGSRSPMPWERLEAIVAGRSEAAALFKHVVAEPTPRNPPPSPAQLELRGAVADTLVRVASLAADIADQLILDRSRRG
jgi:hypothetical protein